MFMIIIARLCAFLTSDKRPAFSCAPSLLAALYLGTLPSNGWAQNVPVSTIEIAGLHQYDRLGAYDITILEVGQHVGLQFTLDAISPTRTFNRFMQKAAVCISPHNNQEEFRQERVTGIATTPLYTASIHIFTRPDDPKITSISELKSLNVGIRSHMPYGKTIAAELPNLAQATNIEANIRKLNSGRLDAFLAYYPDYLAAFSAVGQPPFPNTKILEHQDSLFCQETMEGRYIVEAFNKGLEHLRQTGRLKRIMDYMLIEKGRPQKSDLSNSKAQ